MLTSLPEPRASELLSECQEHRLRAGETLFREGDEDRGFFLVLAGQVGLFRKGKQVGGGGPGECIGEMALLARRERTFTTRALEEALVLELPETTFERHLARDPEALVALLRLSSQRSRRDLDALAEDNLKLQAYATEVERTNQDLTAIRHELEERNRLLERLSSLDTLTGIANRRRFDAVLRHEWRRGIRETSPLSLVFCDIDFFKAFNDSYGHQAGDSCLVRVAQAIQETLNRPADLAARYGGEEFVALLVDTDAEGAWLLAERMRERVASLAIEHRASGLAPHLTVSLGVATVRPRPSVRAEELVRRADAALYSAKQRGRNRVEVAEDPPRPAQPEADAGSG